MKKSELDVNQYLIRPIWQWKRRKQWPISRLCRQKKLKALLKKSVITAALKSAQLMLQRKAQSFREKRRALFNA